MRDKITVLLLGAFVLLMPQRSWAFDKAMVDAFGTKVSTLVCSDGGAWLACYKIDSSECQRVADSFVKPCAQQILIPLQSALSYEEGVQTGQRLLACFNEQFEQSYGSQRLATAECSKTPKHLQADSSGF